MAELAGKVVLVTGGGSGIGLACAAAVLAGGGSVVVTGHRDDQVETARASLDGGDRVLATVADVRDLAALEAAVARAEGRFGRLTGLVCAAGIQIPGTATTASEADWAAVIDVNLSGAFRACKAALPALSRAGGGSIVIVSSVQAVRGKRNGLAYVAAKGGLNAMTRALALDHAADNVRVNAVCPGVVDTPMLRQAIARGGGTGTAEEQVWQWASAQPLAAGIGRPCGPADVAALVAFLLGDGAAYMTGGEHAVDGGLAARLAL